MLPEHGRIACSRCFNGTTTWGYSVFEENGWRLENNPCAWGSLNPIILVLGFSKGTNQTNRLLTTPHDRIPFKGMRVFLTKVLQRVEILSGSDCVDNKIKAGERDFAFGSLIRCSISKYDEKKNKYLKSGDIINSSTTDLTAQRIVSNCMNRFLSDLPDRLKLVLMLSNDNDYIDACFHSLKRIHPNLRRLNEVSYANERVTWVHTIHPSGASGKHIRDWLSATEGKQAIKREYAIKAVRNSGALRVLRSPHSL